MHESANTRLGLGEWIRVVADPGERRIDSIDQRLIGPFSGVTPDRRIDADRDGGRPVRADPHIGTLDVENVHGVAVDQLRRLAYRVLDTVAPDDDPAPRAVDGRRVRLDLSNQIAERWPPSRRPGRLRGGRTM